MTHCIKCHRPLKRATASGMGPVCEKRAAPAPAVGRDLFGYDIPAAAEAARRAVSVFIDQQVLEAQFAVRAGFRAARVRAGVWAK